MSAKRALARARTPGEAAAEERAWAVTRAAYRERAPVLERRSPRRFAALFATALTIGVVVLSPAGATVGRFVTHALGIEHAAPALSSLPSSGRLLVSGPAGTWTIASDGAMRRLGPWPQASWSPHGRFVVTARGDELAALNPRGIAQWILRRPRVSDPRWFSPSGYRVAYLSAGELRVVAGDGSGDHRLAAGVADVAPAWRLGHEYQLAYLTRSGVVVVRDGDSGRKLWSRNAGAGTAELQWSADGRYLLAMSPTAARLYAANGTLVSELPLAHALDGALSPDGHTLALVLGGASDEVVLESLLARKPLERWALPGTGLEQVLWSPDGRWLLVSWPAANEWVFVRVAGSRRIAAMSRISQQLGRAGAFPQLDGWCCTAR